MSRRTQIGILSALVAAACVVQAVAIARAAVPALDAVRFVTSARTIDEIGLLGFLRDQTEPPLFSLSVWGVHTILVAALGDFREAWALSVQLAAALPLMLLPIPVFLLGKRFVGPQAALLGTVLVVCLPEMIRLGADGISDSTHLLWFSLALMLLVLHLSPSDEARLPVLPAWLGGVATAFALLARSEAVLLAIAFCAVISVRGIRQRRLPWRSAIPYSAGLAAILVPYGVLLAVAVSGSCCAADGGASEVAAHVSADFDLEEGERLFFASKDPTTSISRRGVSPQRRLGGRGPKAFGYLPGILALIGRGVCVSPSSAPSLCQVFCVLSLRRRSPYDPEDTQRPPVLRSWWLRPPHGHPGQSQPAGSNGFSGSTRKEEALPARRLWSRWSSPRSASPTGCGRSISTVPATGRPPNGLRATHRRVTGLWTPAAGPGSIRDW